MCEEEYYWENDEGEEYDDNSDIFDSLNDLFNLDTSEENEGR